MTRIYLAEHELKATIIDTPITKKWLERFQHQELPLISNFDFSTRDKLFAILKEYESEMELYKDSDPFDKSVANALSDENMKRYK